MKQKSLTELLHNVEAYLAQSELNGEPAQLYAPIIYSMEEGGKRLRPMLTLLACGIFGDEPEAAMPCAAAVEFFHNFTLLHDDIMDKADKRRGKPTVHKVWNENTAILSGDAMLTLAYQILAECRPNVLKKLLDIFSKTAMEVYEGQQFDMEFETRNDVTEAEYINMIRLKTSVLIANCMKMGAMLAGASQQDADNLYAYGETVGLAFQLQDDLLDVYGDPKVFGKKIGGDICCNKKTFLLIKAMELASPAQREEMERRMAQENFDPEEKIAYFTELYNELGIKGICEERIAALFGNCDRYIDAVSVPADRKEAIRNFADSLLNRIH